MPKKLKSQAKVVLQGGLGNQLFQWAFALSLSEFYDEIHLVPNFKNHETQRINMVNDLINANETNLFFGKMTKLQSLRLKIGRRVEFFPWKQFFRVFTDDNSRLGKNRLSFFRSDIFDGYWQDIKFLNQNNALIFDSLDKFLEERECCNLDAIEHQGDFLVMHVRGTDYLTSNVNRNVYGILHPEYFGQIIDKYPNLDIMVTTDDLQYAKLVASQIRVERFIVQEDLDEWCTLKFIARGKLFIASNSSFSWWCSFYSLNKGSVVHIPNPWFRDPKSPRNLKFGDMIEEISIWNSDLPSSVNELP